MKFGPVPIGECVGGILAHAVFLPSSDSGKTAGRKIAKGSVITADLQQIIADSGITTLTIARLEEDEIGEDIAATRLIAGLLPDDDDRAGIIRVSKAATGRVNIYAECRGVLRLDPDLIRAVNLVDEGITLATLAHNQLVEKGDMIATLKVIPFGISTNAVDAVVALVNPPDGLGDALASVFAFMPLSVRNFALIQTSVDGMKESVLSATQGVTKARLNQLDCTLVSSQRVPHEEGAISAAIENAKAEKAEVILICGASAIADRRDVVPQGIVLSGGTVDHLGLPVDPGNLLMLAHIPAGKNSEIPIIGMPGCARSPKLNGFDWVLHLLLAGCQIDHVEIAGMAVGGLLMEIASRPLPRKMTERQNTSGELPQSSQSSQSPQSPQLSRAPSIAGILLAAGQSRRMGNINKLLGDSDGQPLVRRCAQAMLDGGIKELIVVTGHQASAIERALDGLPLRFVHNPDFATGQAGSVGIGIAAVPDIYEGALIGLGDMPYIGADLIDALIADHEALPNSHSRISFPEHDGRRGNPVIWGRAFFDDLQMLSGDAGGRQILGHNFAAVNSFGWHDDNIHFDIDTPQDALSAPKRDHKNRSG